MIDTLALSQEIGCDKDQIDFFIKFVKGLENNLAEEVPDEVLVALVREFSGTVLLGRPKKNLRDMLGKLSEDIEKSLHSGDWLITEESIAEISQEIELFKSNI